MSGEKPPSFNRMLSSPTKVILTRPNVREIGEDEKRANELAWALQVQLVPLFFHPRGHQRTASIDELKKILDAVHTRDVSDPFIQEEVQVVDDDDSANEDQDGERAYHDDDNIVMFDAENMQPSPESTVIQGDDGKDPVITIPEGKSGNSPLKAETPNSLAAASPSHFDDEKGDAATESSGEIIMFEEGANLQKPQVRRQTTIDSDGGEEELAVKVDELKPQLSRFNTISSYEGEEILDADGNKIHVSNDSDASAQARDSKGSEEIVMYNPSPEKTSQERRSRSFGSKAVSNADTASYKSSADGKDGKSPASLDAPEHFPRAISSGDEEEFMIVEGSDDEYKTQLPTSSVLTPTAIQRQSVENINRDIDLIDKLIQRIFKYIPFCRAYLHWRVLLTRLEKHIIQKLLTKPKETTKISASDLNLGALGEIENNLRYAKTSWSKMEKQIISDSRKFGGSIRKLNLQMQVSLDDDRHPNKGLLATLERTLYSNLDKFVGNKQSDQDDNDEEAMLFWWRFFGVEKEELDLKEFSHGLYYYLKHEYNQFLGDPKILQHMLKITLDTGDNEHPDQSHDNRVSKPEFFEFMHRYGPLRHCFKKTQGVCIITPDGKVKKAPWFIPEGRRGAERALRDDMKKMWVARLGWRKRGMAFVFSYRLTKTVETKGGVPQLVMTTSLKHTPVEHTFRDSGEKMYEFEAQHLKMTGKTMRDLILFSVQDYKKTPIFGTGESKSKVKTKVEAEAKDWFMYMTRKKEAAMDQQRELAIAEGFEEVFDLNDYFHKRNKLAQSDSKSMLETGEVQSLFQWIRDKVASIHRSVQSLSDHTAKHRRIAFNILGHMVIGGLKATQLSERQQKRLIRSFRLEKKKKEEKRKPKPKHFIWALSDYRREGQTVMHELVHAAIALISDKTSPLATEEEDLRSAFRNILSLIDGMSDIGIPLHIENEQGFTPIESIVDWFGKGSSIGLSLTAMELFHELFIAVYERTIAEFAMGMAAMDGKSTLEREPYDQISEQRHQAILVEILRGIIPQGDIEIVDYLLRTDTRIKSMLRDNDASRREANVFLNLTPTPRDNEDMSDALTQIQTSVKGDESGEYDAQTEGQMSFLHYLIYETADAKRIDTHFDAHRNAPRIAHLVFQMLKSKSLQARFCDKRAGPHGDTPILAAARANHQPMLNFLLHVTTKRRIKEIKAQEDNRGSAHTTDQGRPSVAHGFMSLLKKGSLPHINSDSLRTNTLQSVMDLKDIKDTGSSKDEFAGYVGRSICDMVDANGNCLLHFLVSAPNITLRKVSMILLLLDNAEESTNQMVDRMNERNQTPLSKLLKRYKAISGGSKKDKIAEATEMANIALHLLARGARSEGLSDYEMETLAEISGSGMARCTNYRWTILKNAVKYGDDRFVELIFNSKSIRVAPFLKHPRFEKRKDQHVTKRLEEHDETNRGSTHRFMRKIDPFENLSEHTILHVATSSPYSSAQIVETLFSQDQSIADGKLRGRGKKLMLTPEDLMNQQYKALWSILDSDEQIMALQSQQRGLQTTERNLLRLGINLADVAEKNPLHYIASKQNTQTRRIAKLLIDHSVNFLARDEDGLTPLHIAARANQIEIVDLMVAAHVHLDIKTGSPGDAENPIQRQRANRYYKRTALFFAVEQGNWQICSLLLSKKASVENYDSQGKTALTVAFLNHKTRVEDEMICQEAIQSLLKFEARIRSLSNESKVTHEDIDKYVDDVVKKKLEDYSDKKRKNDKKFLLNTNDSCPLQSIFRRALTSIDITLTHGEDRVVLEKKGSAEETKSPKETSVSNISMPVISSQMLPEIDSPGRSRKPSRMSRKRSVIDEKLGNLLSHIVEAKFAFEVEERRVSKIKKNLKDTIDVLLNYGADIEQAFRLVTLRVSDCIDMEKEFETIQHEFDDIYTEVKQAFSQDEKRTMLITARTPTAKKKPMDGKNTWWKNTDSLYAQDKTKNEIKKAITQRREVIFRQKYNQIVMNQKYKDTVRSHRCGELLYYILFLILITYIGIQASSRNNRGAFLFRQSAIQTLVEDEIPFTESRIRRNFLGIDSTQEFYQWARGPFLDVFYPETTAQFYDGENLVGRKPTYLGQGVVIGVPRWRQQRQIKAACNLIASRGLDSQCVEEIDFWPWLPNQNNRGSEEPFSNYTFEETNSAFSYTWASGTGRFYPGGGFNVEFPNVNDISSRNATIALMDFLQNTLWIDALTKVVMVEFNVYNGNENLVMIGSLNLEFPNTGAVFPSMSMRVATQLNHVKFFKESDAVICFLEILCVVMAVWNFIGWMADLFAVSNDRAVTGGKLFIETFYSVVEVLINVLYIVVIVTNVILLFNAVDVNLEESNEHVDMTSIAFLAEMFVNFFSLLLFLLWVKLTELLAVHREVSRLVVMITVLLRRMGSLLFFMLIMWIAFSMGTYVAYGYRNVGNALWITSALTVVSNSFNGYEPDANREESPFMSTLYGVLALIFIILILMNLVIAILTTAYEHAREEVGDAYWARHQYRLVQQYEMVMKAKLWDENCCKPKKEEAPPLDHRATEDIELEVFGPKDEDMKDLKEKPFEQDFEDMDENMDDNNKCAGGVCCTCQQIKKRKIKCNESFHKFCRWGWLCIYVTIMRIKSLCKCRKKHGRYERLGDYENGRSSMRFKSDRGDRGQHQMDGKYYWERNDRSTSVSRSRSKAK